MFLVRRRFNAYTQLKLLKRRLTTVASTSTTYNNNNNNNKEVPFLVSDVAGSYENFTIQTRIPNILTNLQLDLNSTFNNSNYTEKLEDLDVLLRNISNLKVNILKDVELPYLEDKLSDVDSYNQQLHHYKSLNLVKPSYTKLPMMFSETFIFRQILSTFSLNSSFSSYDPFQINKFKAIQESVSNLEKMSFEVNDIGHVQGDEAKFKLRELLVGSCFGNGSDLAFKIDGDVKTKVDLDKLITDGSDKIVEYLYSNKHKPGSLDIILDNCGMELFTDLLLADYLVDQKLVDKVNFYGKPLSWFVSDTTLPDLQFQLEQLLNSPNPNLKKLGLKWIHNFQSDKFNYLTDSFFISYLSYHKLQLTNLILFEKIKNSKLVIFKGDLNYRKLVDDRLFNNDTQFKDAVGALNFSTNHSLRAGPPVVALKVLKSNPIVGLDLDKVNQLENSDKEWRVNGNYGVVQSTLD